MRLETFEIEHDLYIIRNQLLVGGIFTFVLGIILVSIKWPESGSISLLLSLTSFVFYYTKNKKHKEYKSTYITHLKDDEAITVLNFGCFVFKEEFLIYKNKKNKEEINWDNFAYYELIQEKHIVLHNVNKMKSLIISETEMNKINFREALKFIKIRITKKPTFKY